MGYSSLLQCTEDLARTGQLFRVDHEIDPHLEMAEIQRRVYLAAGPALLFPRVKACRFPMVSNLFGTIERARYIFRDALDPVRRLVELKVDPSAFWRRPFRYAGVPLSALSLLPKKVDGGPVFANQVNVSELPALVSWPNDGGPFITLPQVFSEDPTRPGLAHSNLGMYRVQLAGNNYERDKEVGLHYQIHRGIGVHHSAAIAKGQNLKVCVFVGGPPAMTVAAVMPLPEGMSELSFAGVLNRRRVRMAAQSGSIFAHAEADFCIVGEVEPNLRKPEGPFGDHLGYYSLTHDFPVLRVHRVYHRTGAIWPFTVVGRPPQEDTVFGELIHDLTGPLIPLVLPGVKGVHAVDAAGVHPLLLAIGAERYTPYAKRTEPQEILTQANAILGQGQLSLAKYLLIAAENDKPPALNDISAFLQHVLCRIDPRRDLHFQTRTTIDTLDYTGTGLNQGSKLVMAAAGAAIRVLATELPSELNLPPGFRDPKVCMPGVLAVTAPACTIAEDAARVREQFCAAFTADSSINRFTLVLLVDDSAFVARSLHNFLWTTFTRSNPAVDVCGVGAFVADKHWGCTGSLVIDARIKPHHAPPLIEDPKVSARVDKLCASDGPLGPLQL
jgi:4-hydroxy-3-polyprenylbenzoate decarboxylase